MKYLAKQVRQSSTKMSRRNLPPLIGKIEIERRRLRPIEEKLFKIQIYKID